VCDLGGGEVYRIDQVCPTPTTYCVGAANSAGPGALMTFSGTGALPQNNLTLITTGCPSSINGLYFYGEGQTQVPLGNGFRCIASNFKRLPVTQTNIFGDASWTFDNTTAPWILPGSTWNFQFWYRDVPGGGALYNLSNALSVLFCAN